MAGKKKKKPHVKMQCTKCKTTNYFTYKSKNVEGKLDLKKFCNTCREHVAHKELKK